MAVTRPDRPRGRGKKLTAPEVKQAAEQYGIAVYQPVGIDSRMVREFEKYGIELVVVVAYGKILPGEVIHFPVYGTLNLHPSLLPRHRGASPVEAAILSGDSSTGITLQLMGEQMDQGDILAWKEIPVDKATTAEQLLARVIEISPSFLVNSIKRYLEGELKPIKQDHSNATYCPRIRKKDGLINWEQDSNTICRKIKAYNVWPVAFSYLDAKVLKIYDAEPLPDQEAGGSMPGEIVEAGRNQGLLVKASDGLVGVLEVQLENKKRMDFQKFINGYRNLQGKILSSGLN